MEGRIGAALARMRREDVVDAALAVVVIALMTVETLSGNYSGGGMAGVLVWGVLVISPLAVRRRFPVAVWFTVLAVATAQVAVTRSNEGAVFFGVLVGGYTVAAYRPLRPALLCFAALVPVLVYSSWQATGNPFDDLDFVVLLAGGFWVAGRVVWSRGQLLLQLAEQSEELRRSRDAEARAVAAEQREQIARDVHDVVAHSVSIMVVQAEAGEAQLATDGPTADCLRAIQRVGRSTLTELRGLLETLGEGRGPTDTSTSPRTASAPAPRLRDAADLAAEFRRAGLDVDLRLDGDIESLPSGVDLAVYRILQEALTNAFRHGTRAHVTAQLRVTEREVAVEVLDSGSRRGAERSSLTAQGAGRGLVGMRERARLYGGDVESGRVGDGFRVHARIPLPVRAEVMR